MAGWIEDTRRIQMVRAIYSALTLAWKQGARPTRSQALPGNERDGGGDESLEGHRDLLDNIGDDVTLTGAAVFRLRRQHHTVW